MEDISDSEKEQLKDVACVVFLPNEGARNSSIYLIDLKRGKLRGLLHLMRVDEYPSQMAYVVYKSMLYMFGGIKIVNDDVKFDGLPNAYVLDLLKLAKSNDQEKPSPTKLPWMNSGKNVSMAVVMGHKICVYDSTLGYQPPNCHFEVFDPKLKTWDKVQDPFCMERGMFVDAHYVKGDSLFVSIRKKAGIYELNLGASTSPVWRHHDLLFGVDRIPECDGGFQFENLLFRLDKAYDLGDDEYGFRRQIKVTCCGDRAENGFDVVTILGRATFQLGHDKVCMIQSGRKPFQETPRVKPNKFIVSHRKPWTLYPVLRKCRKSKRKSKSKSKKDGYKFLVNVCSVNLASRPIQLKVLRSFRLPMDYDFDVETGYYAVAVSL